MSIKAIRSAWWSLLRDFVFPIMGLFGLYQLFTGHFSELAIPLVGGICMALLGLQFWDRDDQRRRKEEDGDDNDAADARKNGGGSGGSNDLSIRIGLPARWKR